MTPIYGEELIRRMKNIKNDKQASSLLAYTKRIFPMNASVDVERRKTSHLKHLKFSMGLNIDQSPAVINQQITYCIDYVIEHLFDITQMQQNHNIPKSMLETPDLYMKEVIDKTNITIRRRRATPTKENFRQIITTLILMNNMVAVLFSLSWYPSSLIHPVSLVIYVAAGLVLREYFEIELYDYPKNTTSTLTHFKKDK